MTQSNFRAEVREGIHCWVSYSTIVAFYDVDGTLRCSENVWSVTTAKHLNKICPNKSERIQHDNFKQLLNIALRR